MNDAEFHALADAVLNALAEQLDAEGHDAELAGGILTVSLESGRQMVINKHAPSRQLWLASLKSGGLHFSWDGQAWRIVDGRILEEVVQAEL